MRADLKIARLKLATLKLAIMPCRIYAASCCTGCAGGGMRVAAALF